MILRILLSQHQRTNTPRQFVLSPTKKASVTPNGGLFTSERFVKISLSWWLIATLVIAPAITKKLGVARLLAEFSAYSSNPYCRRTRTREEIK
jgi:hypothetical protein